MAEQEPVSEGRLSLLPRWLHRWWANFAGYFWMPCPLCGRYTGGHEWDGTSLLKQRGLGVGVCRACYDRAKALNYARFGEIEFVLPEVGIQCSTDRQSLRHEKDECLPRGWREAAKREESRLRALCERHGINPEGGE